MHAIDLHQGLQMEVGVIVSSSDSKTVVILACLLNFLSLSMSGCMLMYPTLSIWKFYSNGIIIQRSPQLVHITVSVNRGVNSYVICL